MGSYISLASWCGAVDIYLLFGGLRKSLLRGYIYCLGGHFDILELLSYLMLGAIKAIVSAIISILVGLLIIKALLAVV